MTRHYAMQRPGVGYRYEGDLCLTAWPKVVEEAEETDVVYLEDWGRGRAERSETKTTPLKSRWRFWKTRA